MRFVHHYTPGEDGSRSSCGRYPLDCDAADYGPRVTCPRCLKSAAYLAHYLRAVRIGARAADAVLGGGAAVEMGIVIHDTTATTSTIIASRDRLVSLRDEFIARTGSAWSNGAGEAAACRRAAKAIDKTLAIWIEFADVNPLDPWRTCSLCDAPESAKTRNDPAPYCAACELRFTSNIQNTFDRLLS